MASLSERFRPYGIATEFENHYLVSYPGTASRARQDMFDLWVDTGTAEVILGALEKGTLQEAIDTLFVTDGSGALLRKTVELLQQNDDEAWAIRRVLNHIQDWRTR